jgi:hypothetical protein
MHSYHLNLPLFSKYLAHSGFALQLSVTHRPVPIFTDLSGSKAMVPLKRRYSDAQLTKVVLDKVRWRSTWMVTTWAVKRAAASV